MKLAIIGATGYVGKEVLRQAIEAGHEVKILVRNPKKLPALDDRVEVIHGNILDRGAVTQLLQGVDAVLNASGGVKEPDQYDVFKRATEILVRAMKDEGISRLVSINGIGTIFPFDKPTLGHKFTSFMVGLLIGHMKQANLGEMAVLLQAKQLQWTAVRAPQIVDKPGTGEVMVDTKKFVLGRKIMLPDLAMFMLDQLKSDHWVGKAPLVASRS